MIQRPAFQAALVAAFVAVIAVLAFWVLTAPRATPVKPGTRAPDVELQSAHGTKGRLVGTRGAALVVMMIDGHTTDLDLASAERLFRKYFFRGFVMVGVVVDPNPASVRPLLDKIPVTFTVYEDANGDTIAKAGWGHPRPPESYLIGPTGNVIQAFPESVFWQNVGLDKMIDDMLPQPPKQERPAVNRGLPGTGAARP
jgi:hypothetical protein